METGVQVTVDLFVGLVTHPKSRYADAVTPDGLMAQTARGASSAGFEVVTAVSDEDAFDEDTLPIDDRVVRRSITAELDAERRWRRYLAEGSEVWWSGAAFGIRRLVRTARFARPWGSSRAEGAAMVRRLANIELSHLWLLDQACASEAGWVLILEDDAASPTGEQFGVDLATFVRAVDAARQPLMVSMSDSFTPRELGISDLLTPVVGRHGPWPMQEARRAVTNTVCATLYRRGFLVRLAETLRQIPLDPVIPIDFKIDEALMRMANTYRPGDAWLATPAPISQRSGVPAVRFG